MTSRRAACFLSALQMVAGRTGKVDMARNATVHAQVHIGEPEGTEGFALQVDIQVEGVEDIDLIEAGHQVSDVSAPRTMELLTRGEPTAGLSL